MNPDLGPLLEPASIAILGASASPEKPGHVLFQNIIGGDFAGRLYPVNPRGASVAGRKAYASISEVPEQVDLVFVVLNRKHVLAAITECAAAGARAVCIVTAGFGEGDAWGAQQHREIAKVISDSGMVAIGPNTIGTVSMGGSLRGTFVPFPRWEDGNVAIGAQTGIFAGAVMLDVMQSDLQRIGIHASVDIGNRIGIDELALLEAFAAREEINVLGFYLEEMAAPRRFLARAAEVKRTKPIVILKPGRTPSGARASASHTGSLSQDDAVLDHLVAQHGLIRAADVPEFLALLRALSFAGVPNGSRVGVVTYSGALGVIATDELTTEGLELAKVEPGTLETIQSLLPDWQSARNPSDLWSAAEVDPERTLRTGFEAMLADPNVDQVLGVILAVPNVDVTNVGQVFADLRARHPDRPIHLVFKGSLSTAWARSIEGLGIPVYPSTRDAVRVMAATARYRAGRTHIPSAYCVEDSL